MDVFAHTLWAAVVYQKVPLKPRLWAAFGGVAPDLFSFGLLFVQNLFSGALRSGPPELASIPAYVFALYNITHSLVIFGLVVFALYFIRRRKWPWLIGGWGLHIVIDIFTHGREFFPTPFLWPFSTFTVDSFSWAEPWFMAVNYSALAVAYVVWYLRVRRRARPTV
ncbi:MAG: hypothetical protein U1C53_01210 [Candidatus Veblenbacteria bacterium]|nr:hypothetical protein [Candidatus Veblenbacteria bacterium]MDZ4229733.1 hypothetical protein [Candidatus Veblenbacteria bacterium]